MQWIKENFTIQAVKEVTKLNYDRSESWTCIFPVNWLSISNYILWQTNMSGKIRRDRLVSFSLFHNIRYIFESCRDKY